MPKHLVANFDVSVDALRDWADDREDVDLSEATDDELENALLTVYRAHEDGLYEVFNAVLRDAAEQF